jgi:hypothetical protein
MIRALSQGNYLPWIHKAKDPFTFASAFLSPGEPDGSLEILKMKINKTAVRQKRKASAKRVNRVPAICALRPQTIAPIVIAP